MIYIRRKLVLAWSTLLYCIVCALCATFFYLPLAAAISLNILALVLSALVQRNSIVTEKEHSPIQARVFWGSVICVWIALIAIRASIGVGNNWTNYDRLLHGPFLFLLIGQNAAQKIFL